MQFIHMIKDCQDTGFPKVGLTRVYSSQGHAVYYAPNFEEVEEAYWFGLVCAQCVMLCLRSRTVRDRILTFEK